MIQPCLEALELSLGGANASTVETVCICLQLLSGLVGWMREDYWLKKK